MSDQAVSANLVLLQILSNLGVIELSTILFHTKHAVKVTIIQNIQQMVTIDNASSFHLISATTVRMTRPVILTNHARIRVVR